jgi:hypothetical protein
MASLLALKLGPRRALQLAHYIRTLLRREQAEVGTCRRGTHGTRIMREKHVCRAVPLPWFQGARPSTSFTAAISFRRFPAHCVCLCVWEGERRGCAPRKVNVDGRVVEDECVCGGGSY